MRVPNASTVAGWASVVGNRTDEVISYLSSLVGGMEPLSSHGFAIDVLSLALTGVASVFTTLDIVWRVFQVSVRVPIRVCSAWRPRLQRCSAARPYVARRVVCAQMFRLVNRISCMSTLGAPPVDARTNMDYSISSKATGSLVSPVPVQMWQRRAPVPGADAGGFCLRFRSRSRCSATRLCPSVRLTYSRCGCALPPKG